MANPLIATPPIVYSDLGIYCTYAQAVKSDTALNYGLTFNTPTPEQYANMVRVYEHIILPIVLHFGVAPAINSFFRSGTPQKKIKGKWESVNSIVGGSPTSDHPNGRAVDLSYRFVKTPYTNIDLGRWCRDNLDFDQEIVEKVDPLTGRPAWVHLSWRSKEENRHQVLEAKFTDGKAKYIPL